MTELPDPLVPAEVDLQDFAFMPLQVARLRDSDFAATVHPEAGWYAVLLWAASWHQIPAGSLPDNDAMLMRLVGLGRDARTWKKHRAEALYGFILCKDGRLYHPIVAEEAKKSWGEKVQQRHRTFCAAIRKHNERNPDNKLKSPTFDEWVELGRPDRVTPIVTSLSRVTDENVARDIGSKGQGQGQGQGHTNSEEANASIAQNNVSGSDEQSGSKNLFGEAEPPPPAKPELKPEHFVESWNDLATRCWGGRTIRDLTPERRQTLKARINGYGLDDFLTVLGKIPNSPFLRGDTGWRGCTFDWVIKKANFQKILEGNYDG